MGQKYNLAMLLFGLCFITSISVVGASSQCSNNAGSSNFQIVGVNWGNGTSQIAAGPGQRDVPLTLTIESLGSTCSLSDVEGYLTLGGGLTNFNGSSYATSYISSINGYSLTNMLFHLNIGSNLTVGSNTIMTFPFYLYWNTTNTTVARSQAFTLQIPLHGSASLSLKASPPSFFPGSIQNLTISVRNAGTGTLSGIVLGVTSSSSISILSQPQTISQLSPNQTKNVSMLFYSSPGIATQAVQFNIASHYIDPYGYNASSSSTLGLYALQVSQPPVAITIANQTLVGGVVVTRNITITNNAAQTITNLTMMLNPTSPLELIGAEGSTKIPSIKPGQHLNVPVALYLSSSSTVVSTLGIDLSYQQSTTNVSRSIDFVNPGYINVTSVSTIVVPASPTPGQIFSITSTLNNVGTQSASSATVAAIAPAGITPIVSGKSFIGTIQPGQPTAFTLSFTVNPSTKPGKYVIPVTLSYLNNLEQSQNQSFTFSVDVVPGALNASSGSTSSQSSTSRPNFTRGNSIPSNYTGGFGTRTYQSRSSLPLIIIGVIVIAVLALLAYLYKKGRLNPIIGAIKNAMKKRTRK